MKLKTKKKKFYIDGNSKNDSSNNIVWIDKITDKTIRQYFKETGNRIDFQQLQLFERLLHIRRRIENRERMKFIKKKQKKQERILTARPKSKRCILRKRI